MTAGSAGNKELFEKCREKTSNMHKDLAGSDSISIDITMGGSNSSL